jgi:hypothetical protein
VLANIDFHCHTSQMFIKRTQSGGHTYLQLVESYRNEQGLTRQRTVATLGRADEVGGGAYALLAGLMRATGRGPVADVASNAQSNSSSR